MSTYTIYDMDGNGLGDVQAGYLPVGVPFQADSQLTDAAIAQLGVGGDDLVIAEFHRHKQP